MNLLSSPKVLRAKLLLFSDMCKFFADFLAFAANFASILFQLAQEAGANEGIETEVDFVLVR